MKVQHMPTVLVSFRQEQYLFQDDFDIQSSTHVPLQARSRLAVNWQWRHRDCVLQ